jgi:polyhydroxyalkanoate synthesis regulator phasin
MSRERAEKIFDEYVAKGQAAKDARTGFVKEVMDSADKTRSELEKLVSKQVAQTVDNLQLAGKADIQRLEQKLDQLMALCKKEQ